MHAYSKPLYSRIDGLTFSVVVAHEATALAHSGNDRYNRPFERNAPQCAGLHDRYGELLPLAEWHYADPNLLVQKARRDLGSSSLGCSGAQSSG
jgi:hypothetical protein